MIDYLITGISFGFIAGISPGPLLTLVISETIKYNHKEGIKIALSPLLTDIPIMLFTLYLAFKLQNFDTILGIICFLGAIFISYLAIGNLRVKSVQIVIDKQKSQSYKKGIIANILSPHPYLFWLLIGSPFLIKAYKENPFAPFLFILGFYTLIVGTKITIAIISEKSKNILSSKAYIIIVKILGFILLLFSIILIKDGFEFFGVPILK